MRIFYGGLAAALLCVALVLPFGCGKEEPLYSSLEADVAETETDVRAESTSETYAPPGYVYVCGAVKNAAVYPITDGMRVCDAIALAGGFASDADREWLNQAESIYDGQKIYVYTLEETGQLRESGAGIEGEGPLAGSADTPGAAGSTDGKVNLNTASREELMSLPGIGEAKADAILAYRSEYGPFSSIEEIQNISGIKSGVFSKIQDLITV